MECVFRKFADVHKFVEVRKFVSKQHPDQIINYSPWLLESNWQILPVTFSKTDCLLEIETSLKIHLDFNSVDDSSSERVVFLIIYHR